jgi:hypothetical protein
MAQAVTLLLPLAVVEAEASTAVAAEGVIGKRQASNSSGLRNNPQPVSFAHQFHD